MGRRVITVAEPVRQKVVAQGTEGERWLRELGDLLASLEQAWQISIGEMLEGGTEAYVARASTGDGAAAILKIAIPYHPGNTVLAHELAALRLAGGRGYVRLLRFDLPKRALLLEPLGPALRDLGYTTRAQIESICAALKEAWVRPSSATALPSGASAARWHARFIARLWEQLNRPCPASVVETARVCALARAQAFDPAHAVLVHGDAHSANALLDPSRPASFKLIDPDGIVAEAACDLGVLMREWMDELAADPLSAGQQRCTFLSQLTGEDPQAIWQWGFLQCMSTGLLLLHVGQSTPGLQMLRVAREWARVLPSRVANR